MLLVVVFALAVSHRTSAVIILNLNTPQDDPMVRRALIGCGANATTPVSRCLIVQPLGEEYQRLIETRIWPLHRAEVAKYFGPALLTTTNWWKHDGDLGGFQIHRHPKDLVLPVYVPSGLMISGLHSTDPEANKNHTDLHAIGKLGYIEIYYQNDGEGIQTAVLYSRANKRFVPLKSPGDFEERFEWDKAHFALIKKWFNQHLPRIKDLGTVEVMESAPTRVKLDRNRTCVIKTQINRHPDVTNDWYSLTLSLDPAEADSAKRQYVFRSVSRPNTPIGFAFDGDFFELMPKLKK